MRRFLAARLAQTVIVVWVVTTITFFLIHLSPGNPFAVEDRTISPDVLEQRRRQFGYDRPLGEQYVKYIANVARGNLGISRMQHRPASTAIREALPRTLALTGVSLALSLTLGVIIGLRQAARHGSAFDRRMSTLMMAFYSIPDVWLAILMMLVFAVWIPAFPAGGMETAVMHDYMGFWRATVDSLYHLVLPVATLTLLTTAAIARYQRAALIEVLPLDFVRTARAKGADERRVVWRHALRNAAAPIVTLIGLLLPALIGGALFVEVVFTWPGMGMLTAAAVQSLDYDVVTASVIVGATVVSLGSLVADLLLAWIDPRVRLG